MLQMKVVILKYDRTLSWRDSNPSHFEGKTWIFDIFSLISGKFFITFAVFIQNKKYSCHAIYASNHFVILWSFVIHSYIVSVHIQCQYIYTFVVSRACMAGAASQAGDADSSRAPGLTSGLQGSVNVHRGTLLFVPQ